MKNIFRNILLAASILLLPIVGCKNQLEIKNPNNPTLAVLKTEDGMNRLAMSVYAVDNSTSIEGGLLSFRFMWITMANHEIMGDAMHIPWGNFAWRWMNQVAKITIPNGTTPVVSLPPVGLSQPQELANRNSRAFQDDNGFLHEWQVAYFINNTCNLILENVESTSFAGDATSKRNILKAWARFWKGYAYSRIGSMYSGGLILNNSGQTQGGYVDNIAILSEATSQLDQANALLASLPAGSNSAIDDVFKAAIPDFIRGSVLPTPASMIRSINSLKARNLMVNKRVSGTNAMTATDWNQVITLANNGVLANDFVFFGVLDGTFFTSTAVPYRTQVGWHFPSQRILQDFQTGDSRRSSYFIEYTDPVDWYVNQRNRGLQFGATADFADSDLTSITPKKSKTYFTPTYEENQLMLAEARIRTNLIEAGLANIDAVRTLQASGLAATVGTGLTQAQAIEQLRSERRIGLLLRGLSFYDARRWGVNDPASMGGGRQNAHVVVPGALIGAAAAQVRTDCTIEYNYLNYFGVPASELDFNKPSSGVSNITPR